MKIIFFTIIIFLSNNIFAQDSILFFDDFDNNINKWDIIENQNFITNIEKSEMIIFNKTGSISQLKTFYINPNNNFSIETSIKQSIGDINLPYGIIFGAIDWDNLYCFSISSNGFYQIFKIQDGKFYSIKEWTETAMLYPKYYKNILAIENKDNSLLFKINNETVFLKKDLNFFGTKYGFFVDGKIKIKIDYFKIIHPPIKKQVTGYPITINDIKKLDIKCFKSQTLNQIIFSNFDNKLYVSAQNIDNKKYNNDIFFSNLNINNSFDTLQLFDKNFNNEYSNSIINIFDNSNTLFSNGIFINDTNFIYTIALSNYENNKWTQPKEILIENTVNLTENTDYYVTDDKTILLLACEKKNNFGFKDLYITTLSSKGYYNSPTSLGESINTFANEGSPFMTADKKQIFFYSSALPGFGGNDIFVIQRLDSTFYNWSEPQNLGPVINSSANETNFFIDDLNQKAFFISDKEGNQNIYFVEIFKPFFKNFQKKASTNYKE